MNRYLTDETVSSYGKQYQPSQPKWIDAESPEDAIDIYGARFGLPLSVRRFGAEDERTIGDPVLRASYDYGQGEELTVTVYIYEEVMG